MKEYLRDPPDNAILNEITGSIQVVEKYTPTLFPCDDIKEFVIGFLPESDTGFSIPNSKNIMQFIIRPRNVC